MIIYKGKRAVFGVQLTIDRVWRYAMTSEDSFQVKVMDDEHQSIVKNFTSADVDEIDKQITVELTPEETSALSLGRGTLRGYLNDLLVIPPTEIYIKEA